MTNPTYQVKLGSRWEDMQLNIDSIDAVAKELNTSMAGILAMRQNSNLGRIHQMVLQHHGATKTAIKEIFDIICINYQVQSFEDDTLKFTYSFMLRFGTDKEREKSERLRIKHAEKERKTKSTWPLPPGAVSQPKIIEGEITLMPGN